MDETAGGRRRRRRVSAYLGLSLLLLISVLGFVIIRPNGAEAIFADGSDGRYSLEPVAEGLEAPTDVAAAGDGSGRLFIVERAGRVQVADRAGVTSTSPLLDLSDDVATEGEGGMLAIALHPDFASDDGEGAGRIYVTWTTPDHALKIGEFSLRPGSDVVEPSHRIILEIPQPTPYHNGGDLAFGPDGYLYVSVGDGAWPSTQGLQAQSLTTLFGKILRLDVSHDRSAGEPYAIPPDNPFINDPEARPEIYAFGLRNPWRISFHGEELWAGDVGGAGQEEINLIRPGGNYGWPIYEGNSFKFPGGVRHIVQGRVFEYVGALFRMNFTGDGRRLPPIAAYEHGSAAAVTGGVVVSDAAGLPSLTGQYLFSDFVKGRIWALDAGRDPVLVTTLVAQAGPIVSFAESPTGEVLVSSLAGTVFRLVEDQ